MIVLLAMTALAATPPGRVVVEAFGPEDGLPGAQVRALALDDEGQLLVGTEAGACRFDGRACAPLPAPPGLERAFVSGLYAEGGRVWVSCSLGVYRVEGDEATLLDAHVISVPRSGFTRGPEGGLVLVDEAGIWAVGEASLARRVGPEAGWGWVAAAHAGALWVGGPEGLFTLEPGGLRRVSEAPVRALASRGGALLAGTPGGLVEDGELTVEGCFMTDLAWLPSGRRVLACGDGARVEDPAGGFEAMDADHGLPTSIVLQVRVDRDGQLWLGTMDHGLLRVADPDLRLWDPGTGLPSPHVTGLALDGEDLLVATRGGGLRVRADGSWGLEREGELRRVVVLPEGPAWLDAQARLHLPGGQPLAAGEALGTLHPRADGRIVQQGSRHLWLLDPQRPGGPPEALETPEDLIDAWGAVRGEALLMVGAESVWRWRDGEGFTVVGPSPRRCGGSIVRVWGERLAVACEDRLHLGSPGRWEERSPGDGQPVKGLSVLGDALVVSTLTGIWRLGPRPARLDRGTPGLSFSAASGPLPWGDWLALPAGQGLVWLRPGPGERPRAAPQPRLRAVFVGDREVDDLSTLRPEDRLLRLELGSDSLVDPTLLRHRFRLDGGEWSPPFAGETLHLPGLASGDHSLELEVAFAGGPWSPEKASLGFELPPPWHERGGIRAGALALLLGLLGLVWRERTRRLTEELRRLSEQEAFRQVFGRFVDPRVAEQALSGRLKAEGERREVSVLFADLRGFTPLAESLPPRALVALLNAWLTAMVEEVEARGGVVNKFAGDAVVAIFGAPLDQPDHADRALRAAEAMGRATRRLSAEREARGEAGLSAGVGVNSGEVIAGPVGAASRMEYTVIGEVVNVAARVEALTRALGVEVLITEATRARLTSAPPLRAMGAHRLKGVGQAVEVWAPGPVDAPPGPGA